MAPALKKILRISELTEMLSSVFGNTRGNEELQEEIEGAKTLILQAKALTTTKSYLSHIRRFRRWAEERGVSWLPASRSSVLAFLGFLQKNDGSRAIITGSRAAISWAHKIGGLDSPTNDSLVAMCVQGALRMAKKPLKTHPFSKGVTVRLFKETARVWNL